MLRLLAFLLAALSVARLADWTAPLVARLQKKHLSKEKSLLITPKQRSVALTCVSLRRLTLVYLICPRRTQSAH